MGYIFWDSVGDMKYVFGTLNLSRARDPYCCRLPPQLGQNRAYGFCYVGNVKGSQNQRQALVGLRPEGTKSDSGCATSYIPLVLR